MALAIQRAISAFSDTIEVERQLSGTYDEHGKWQDYGTTTIEIKGSLQTMTDRELMALDEGRRVRGGIKIYTKELLNTLSQDSKVQPDVIIWNDARWMVDSVVNWSELAGYYKVTAIRMGA